MLFDLNTQLKFSQILDRISGLTKVFYLYLAFVGIFGFSCFIMEEGIQLISFANFSASDNRNYATMMANLDLVEDINGVKRGIANWTLWLIPPQRYAYLAYADAVDRYIQTLRMEILANEPELFAGRTVTIENFRYLRLSRDKSGTWIASSRDIDIYLDEKPGRIIEIKGEIRLNESGRVVIGDDGS
jgi:hypothetical protein